MNDTDELEQLRLANGELRRRVSDLRLELHDTGRYVLLWFAIGLSLGLLIGAMV